MATNIEMPTSTLELEVENQSLSQTKDEFFGIKIERTKTEWPVCEGCEG